MFDHRLECHLTAVKKGQHILLFSMNADLIQVVSMTRDAKLFGLIRIVRMLTLSAVTRHTHDIPIM